MFMRYAKIIAMPSIKDLVNSVVSVVADVTEIPCETIMSRCSRAEVVDARWIAVYILHSYGAYTMKISEHMGVTPRYVQYIITDFGDRIAMSRPMRNNYEKIANKLRKDLEITALAD